MVDGETCLCEEDGWLLCFIEELGARIQPHQPPIHLSSSFHQTKPSSNGDGR